MKNCLHKIYVRASPLTITITVHLTLLMNINIITDKNIKYFLCTAVTKYSNFSVGFNKKRFCLKKTSICYFLMMDNRECLIWLALSRKKQTYVFKDGRLIGPVCFIMDTGLYLWYCIARVDCSRPAFVWANVCLIRLCSYILSHRAVMLWQVNEKAVLRDARGDSN